MVIVAMLALAGCATTRTVASREKQECELPAIAAQPVAAPPKLAVGATNGDLRRREQALELALEKANQRITEAPGLVECAKAPEPAAPAPGLWTRIKNWF